MMAGQPQQVLITQQVSAKEPTTAADITLEDLVRLKTEYAEYIRGNAGQPCNKIDRYLTSGAARSLNTMTPVGMSTMERINYHINTIQSGYGGNASIPYVTATANSLLSNLQAFYNSPLCPKILCTRYIETVSSWAQKFEDVLHRYKTEITAWNWVDGDQTGY
jgi:hypothetical protein